MHRSSDSIHSAAAGPLLQIMLATVLLAAGFAGAVVTVNAHLGLLALGFALVAGPVGVVVEDRLQAARRAGAADVAGVSHETHAAPV